MHTFFLPTSGWCPPYQVTGQEARHLATVLRIKPGETVRMLDGAGREGLFTVVTVAKNSVLLEPETIVTHPKPNDRITLALGYGKGLRRSWLLEKAVELEAGGIWFWQAERSQGKVPDDGKDTWLTHMAAGAKQSRNPWLPELRTLPGGVKNLVEVRATFAQAYILWEGEDKENLLTIERMRLPEKTLFVLGPEGGFSDRELHTLTNGGFTPVSLGKRILRWETAALTCLGIAWWMRQQIGCVGGGGEPPDALSATIPG